MHKEGLAGQSSPEASLSPALPEENGAIGGGLRR